MSKHRMSDRMRSATSDHPGTREFYASVADELDRMHAIVERLPKTADGVRVAMGDTVYVRRGIMDGGKVEPCEVMANCLDPYDAFEVHQAYSTRAAAEAARSTQ